MDREKAVEWFTMLKEKFVNTVYEKYLEMAIKAIEQEPRTGRWVVTDDDLVYCSECEDSYYPRPIDASWYYCPHCGAKME